MTGPVERAVPDVSAVVAGRAVPPGAGAQPLHWARALIDREASANLLRQPRRRLGGSGTHALVEGREVVVFSSNDYLGLATHAKVTAAAAKAAAEFGVGATGSRHLSGCHAVMDMLEKELAAFESTPTATLAPSGYAANLAVLVALGGKDAVVLSDERNHASVIDGCRLSRASVEVFRHRDLDHLERRLRAVAGRPVVVSDTVFSMDGTIADVAGLHALARRYSAWLVLDEAHATGVLGDGGRGVAALAGIDPQDPQVVRVVTLSKALGAGGGAVCGAPEVRSLLFQRGRALIFSTAMPHPTVAAARAALGMLTSEPELVDRLHARTARLRSALSALEPTGHPQVPIIPVMVGDPWRAVALEAKLLEDGHLIQAVRPPTVPPGTSRLRLAISAAHTEVEIDRVAAALLKAMTASAATALQGSS